MMKRFTADKANANHPFRLARAELIQAVALHPSHVSSSSTPSSTPCQGSTPMNAEGGGDYRHYLQLTDWGVPISTAARWAEQLHIGCIILFFICVTLSFSSNSSVFKFCSSVCCNCQVCRVGQRALHVPLAGGVPQYGWRGLCFTRAQPHL